ncbi:MAG: TRAM domain-containing protein [Lentilitoribacter sp.]
MSQVELTIDHVGARGDGIAKTDNGPVFIPFALKGETVSVDLDKSRGVITELKSKSPDRVDPACQHFQKCGGCVAQHMSDESYQSWKLDIAQQALDKSSIKHKIDQFKACSQGERRRVVLTAERSNEETKIGYLQAGSHDLIAIHECPVAHPQIVEHLDLFRDIAQIITPHYKTSQLTILLCENGFDIAVEASFSLKDATIHAVSQKATSTKAIKRLAFNGEVLVEIEPTVLTFGDTLIQVPSGSFVQASKRAELEMVELVTKHLKSCKKVVDLFSGSGTFTFPLAQKSAVHAVETSGPALNSIDRGFRSRQGLKPISTERRDLFRSPFVREDLKPYQGVIFDPPRAGAEAQSKQLARALNIKKVAAVSCNPVSLARDLELLVKGGFKIKSITAIDQFLWSTHVEMVALLER